jgi:endonuclease/exonuclease/phosphatase family metal-dependent hydrolase
MRLVTWNIRGCLGMDNRRSVERVADVIRECRADIVCLQEVHRWLPQSRMRDQPRRLSELLGMRSYYLPSYHILSGSFGNAILTNLPVREHWRDLLPNHWERRSLRFLLERRTCVSADIEAVGGVIRVMTAHLSLNRFDRLKSVQRVGELVRGLQGSVVLCGDMNARPDSEEMRILEQSGLVDAGSRNDAPTYPATRPNARIDYVWHSRNLELTESVSVDSQASDHFPVIAELVRSSSYSP